MNQFIPHQAIPLSKEDRAATAAVRTQQVRDNSVLLPNTDALVYRGGVFGLTSGSVLRLLFLLLLLIAVPAKAAAAEKNVLLLYTDKSDSLMPAYGAAIRATLIPGSKVTIRFYEEYTDLWKFSGEDYGSELNRHYSQKYKDQKFDLIIAEAVPVLRFLLKYGDTLFPGTPIVFGAADTVRLEEEHLNLKQNITGILLDLKYGETLAQALVMQPDIRKVVVVAGTSDSDRKYLAVAREDFRKFKNRVEFTYLTDLPIEELEKRLSRLTPEAITFYVSLYRDGAGQAFPNIISSSRITKASSVPTYSVSNNLINSGSIGGFGWNMEAEGTEVAKLGLRLLAGEKPSDIPVRIGDTSRYMFNWLLLQRWGIDAQKLPPGSILRFREPTFWEQYKWRIIALTSLCILQALLIILLVANSRKRRQAEEEKKKLAAIVESSDEAISSVNMDGKVTSWNSGAEKMYGFSAGEMLGQHVSLIVPEDLRKDVPDILERIGREEGADDLETVRVTKDGRLIDVSMTISPIKDDLGTITGASTIARDITARKQADKERRESEERFRMMADTAPVMIWVSGTDTLSTFFNRQWLEFTGRTLEQELGMGWCEGLHPEDSERCMTDYLSAFYARRAFEMEVRVRRADGQYRWVGGTAVPRMMPNGDLAGYIGSCLDITERRQEEKVRQQLTVRLLMMQDEERQRVAAELHDGLGQSLAIIKNRAMIGLRYQTAHDQLVEQLKEISITATAAILEVREIAHNLRPYELDRLGLISAIESMIQRVSESTSISLSACLNPVEGLLSPEAETSVYRIVQEGLNNVIKHSYANAARIEIIRDGNHLTVSVQDNGMGIPLSKPGGNGRSSGGVGLAGIAERVRGLGGALHIDSGPERGTKLTIRLESAGVAAE